MDSLTQVFAQNIVVIYFFYGLAFFVMGMALIIESGRSSDFPFARAMGPLAAFAIIHGLHEWLEMFQLLNRTGATVLPNWVLNEYLRIGHLAISFAFLIVFGVQLVYANHRPQENGRRVAYAAAGAMLFIWLVTVLATRSLYDLSREEAFATADVLSRYMLAIPGALFAAWAILLEQRTFKARGMPGFGRALLGAAVALALYGIVGQLFPRPSFLFPANILNSQTFLDIVGAPVQLFRTACALLMTAFILRALRAFDLETQQKLAAAQQAQIDAQASLEEAVGNLSSLYSLSRSLARTQDERQLLGNALNEFVAAEPHIDAGIIFWQVGEQQEADPAIMTQCPADPQLKAAMFAQATAVGAFVIEVGANAWWNGQAVSRVDDPAVLDENYAQAQRTAATAGHTIGVPLLDNERVVGSLVMCSRPSQPPFSSREYALIVTAAEQISIATQNIRLYQKLQERDELRGELLHQVVSAQEKERQRIARELHDGPAQTLTALGLGLAATETTVASHGEPLQGRIKDLRLLSGAALTELRDILADLRPSVLDDLGLVPAIRGQVQAFEARSGVATRLLVNEPVLRLPPDVETVIFRIIQESLTNIYKHASATSATVELVFGPESLRVVVADNGTGFDTQRVLHQRSDDRQAWGLLGLQERVALTGGNCQIISAPEEGTIIDICIPVMSKKEEPLGEN